MIQRRLVALAATPLAFAALLTPALAAQEAPPPVAWFFELAVTPTQAPLLEEGMIEWRQRQAEDGETWTWNVFESITGPGEYVVMTPFHDFADFDRGPIVDESRMEDNDEFFQESLAPNVSSVHSRMMVFNEDFSVPMMDPNADPPLWQVIEFEWTEGSTEAYLAISNAMAKVKEAFEAGNAMAAAAGEAPGAYNAFELLFGEGPGGLLVALPLDNFAALDGGDPLGFFTAMVATHGHEDAVMIDRVLTRYMKQVASNLYAFRADLSYDPGM